MLLGTPVGDQEFIREKIVQKIEKVRVTTDHLPLLQDAHTAFVLLQSCLALMYTLHTVDPTNYQTQWQEFDMNMINREALIRILECPVDDL